VNLRRTAGALLYDWVPFALRMRGFGARPGKPEPWLTIRNRDETISVNERGVECHWRFTSDLHIANVFPSTAPRLMRRSLERWPIATRDAPEANGDPRVSFIIGHRGTERLPHLLATLRSIAGQSGVPIECIVVEQSAVPEVEQILPRWVRYIHTPLPRPDLPYCRSWAFNVAVPHARSDILLLHDNDMLVPERYAFEALQRIEDGFSFVDLKRFVFYLSEESTRRVFDAGIPAGGIAATVVQNLVGGSIAVQRRAYDAVGGFDESFVGWGGEDNDFFDRAVILGGVYRFGYMPLLHLHHAPQPGKLAQSADAIKRYRAVENIDARERIARLRALKQGRMEGPNTQNVP
jgi:hypothetical protein